MVRIGIIGTAGRKDDGPKMSSELFEKMFEHITNYITEELGYNLSEVELVSGGAAWADHLAVVLYLTYYVKSLMMYLPAKWEEDAYHDTGVVDWRTNPGGTSNYYHRKFSEKYGKDSLKEIQEAIDSGAEIDCTTLGFHNRNSQVAKVDHLIAYTWGTGDKPKDGGTLNTWSKCKSKKVHIPLSSL